MKGYEWTWLVWKWTFGQKVLEQLRLPGRSIFMWERWNKEALSYKVDSSKQTRAILVNKE